MAMTPALPKIKNTNQGTENYRPMKKTISINPLCEFLIASDRRKKSIIKNQKNPPVLMVAPYATARSRITKFFTNDFSEAEILSGIRTLENKANCDTDYQKRDRSNSIEALRKFLQLQFPKNFKKLKCSFSKEKVKEVNVDNISIRVSPDIIIRWQENGQKYIGGIKFHISKGKPFEHTQCIFAANLVRHFIEERVATKEEIVVTEYCLSVDIFGDRVCSASKNKKDFLLNLLNTCKEISTIWDAA